MLDTASLRVAFGVVGLTMLVLFYFGTFRPTRTPYSGWWCAALALFMAGSSAYLLNATSHQWWANPLANTLLVLGAQAVWMGARSLRDPSRPRLWPHIAAPVAMAVASFLDDPATNVWSGGYLFLLLMSMLVGLASVDLWRVWLHDDGGEGSHATYTRVVHAMALTSGLFSIYYFARWVTFLAVGQDGHVFTTYFGSAVTTLVTTVLLVTVSFSMSSLSNAQLTQELRIRASRDDLTGLLNRGEFIRLAKATLSSRRGGKAGALILADLDHFKLVNDNYGHGAGDRVLQSFAAACRSAIRSTDLAGRFGGEEFVLFLPGATPRRAESVTAQISRYLHAMPMLDDQPYPTVSYGIASIDRSIGLEGAIESADVALYRAKAMGRNRAVHTEPAPPLATNQR